MNRTSQSLPRTRTRSQTSGRLRRQYGDEPLELFGTETALYERHLVFDNVVDAGAVGAREQFEALARSVRDVLSQRWIKTESTYARENVKRVYYLSMEFLIGRSLANNVTNLLLAPIANQVMEAKDLDWRTLVEEEPEAGLGNGGLGRLAACFLDSMATMAIPAMGYGLRSSTGCSSKPFAAAGNTSGRTTGCAITIPGRSRARLRPSR